MVLWHRVEVMIVLKTSSLVLWKNQSLVVLLESLTLHRYPWTSMAEHLGLVVQSHPMPESQQALNDGADPVSLT